MIRRHFRQEHDLVSGFDVENERAPKPLGTYWLRFYHDTSALGNVGIDLQLAH